MKSKTVLTIFLILIGCAWSAANSIDSPELEEVTTPWTFNFYFENDLFANTDRNYTNGTKISFISPDVTEYFEAGVFPDWIYRASRYLPFINEEGVQRNVALSIGQNTYTPDDISQTALIPDDRPYAGWLYLGIAFHNRTETWMDVMEVNFGVVGPWSFAEETQNFVHKTRSIPTANGWANQIKNEPVLNFIWERKWKKTLLTSESAFGADLISHFGLSLGNLFTYSNAGFLIRGGWNLPKDFGTSVIRPAGDTNAPFGEVDRPFSIHFFAGAEGRGVARDLTLDGNTFRDSHSIEKENWLIDRTAGIAIAYGRWQFSYAQVFRSPTYKNGLRQTFGSITIHYSL